MNDELIISRMNELESLILQLRKELKESVHPKSDSFPNQEYFTLREAVELKYGKNFPYTTVSTNYEIVAGCRRWKAPLIREWVNVVDNMLIPYLRKYNVPLTGRIGEKYLKKYGKEDSV